MDWGKLLDEGIATGVYILLVFITSRVRVKFRKRAKESPGKLDDVLTPLCFRALYALFFVGWAVFIVTDYIEPEALAAVGIGGSIIGFSIAQAAKGVLSDAIGTISILASRSFEIGDTITVDGVEGKVLAINFSNVKLEAEDGDVFYLSTSKVAHSTIRVDD